MSVLGTLASTAMAVAPPLAYSDQYLSIIRKKNSAGFSIDICGVLLVANITRIWYWLGARFQTALLVQSILMVIFQFMLLYVCLKYKPRTALPEGDGEEAMLTAEGGTKPHAVSRRPFNLWAWSSFGGYIEFLGLYTGIVGLSYLLLHNFEFYITLLGFAALGLEATLPLPQVIVNWDRKSTAGFRPSVLVSWAGGDFIKLIYYLVSPGVTTAFKACAVFQLSIDFVLLVQTYAYRRKTASDMAEMARVRDGLHGEEGVAGPEGALFAARGSYEEDGRGQERYEDRDVEAGRK